MVSENLALARERDQNGSMGRKKSDPNSRKAGSKEDREASKENLPRRKYERVNGRKSSPGRPGKSWFHFNSSRRSRDTP